MDGCAPRWSCALHAEPASQLLLLDEPTNNLDPVRVGQLESAFNAYQGTFVVVSHDERFLAEIGTECRLRLSQGQLMTIESFAGRYPRCVAIIPDSSPYGGQTVAGPGWPNVDEEALAAAAASYEALAAKLTGSVVPAQQGQLMGLSDSWKGAAALAAAGEASMIIGGHETNAAQAAAIAAKLRAMEATVVKTKALVNATAVETQHECEAISALPFSNTQELVQSRIKFGLSQNIAYVTANTTELAGTLGVPASIPQVSAPPTGMAAGQAGRESQQAMQMLGQMGPIAGQLPQQLGVLLTQVPQQLSQPLQQLTSLFGQAGKTGSEPTAMMGLSSFSNHPLAGGSGAGGGGGMVRAASLPGSGGTPAQTPLLANLVGSNAAAVAPTEAAGASSAAVGGVAPVATGAGMGGMGGMGMLGTRGVSGGTASSLSLPPRLDHDLAEDDLDDDW